ncbi:ScbR family autoregulator-binding transcription factor [Streptomyces olivoreticuli]|uniref:ScbR family autoregulator-binding transcription factor n=1 Tax=Streptomyces olivoreticuli TaxID=68246 RepID=UPI000E25E8FC|nr:ScbR family autoregulator-binding transcription factor [Streptomyces olivoreticuli]
MPATDRTAEATTGTRATRPAQKELKQERARITRGQILHTAAELFARNGYPSVTLQDVAEGVSLTKGAVYFHFANKEALAVAVVQEHYRRWDPIVQEILDRGLSPLSSLFAVLESIARAFREDIMIQGGARLQLERSLINADLPTPYISWTAAFTSLCRAARESGQLRPEVDPGALARVLVSTLFGLQHISDVLHGRADMMDRYEEMRDIVFAGLVTAPPADA